MLTGTERAAHRLALGVLRQSVAHAWLGRDSHGGHLHEARAHDALGAVAAFYDDARIVPNHAGWIIDTRPASGWRPVRARLCLFLRATLRADADDFGDFARVAWGGDEAGESKHARLHEAVECARRWTLNEGVKHEARLVRPLWAERGAGAGR